MFCEHFSGSNKTDNLSRVFFRQQTSTMSTEQWTKVADIRPYMKGVNVHFIVLEKVSVTKTKEDHTVNQYLVADPSGAIILSVWDEPGELLQPGDIIQLRQGYVIIFGSKNNKLILLNNHLILSRSNSPISCYIDIVHYLKMLWYYTLVAKES
jgi:hypothetical protein